ncbi:DUF2849 domain-containing protein [Ahrensia kielensis]|uniref:DUF2849 domain-containing protein n=1 Tax=Ahrensia kielensis TaxID=76980 RepID=A0ABU9T821_9HYPH
MARNFVPQIITANDLFEGDVIYLKADGTWARDIAEAHIADSVEQVENMLKIANGQQGSVVGAYAMKIEIDADGKPAPDHFREEFRTRGPSNYFHGKQADTKQIGA